MHSPPCLVHTIIYVHSMSMVNTSCYASYSSWVFWLTDWQSQPITWPYLFAWMNMYVSNVVSQTLRTVGLIFLVSCLLADLQREVMFRTESDLHSCKESPEKDLRLQRDLNPWSYAIPVRCSTNWAVKPCWKQVKSEFNSYPLYEESEIICIW